MEKYDGIHDNKEISWNGRAYVTSDISDLLLFDIFFDAALPEEVQATLFNINEVRLRGEDSDECIPCDCLNAAAIYALKNQIFDEWRGGCKNADKDGCLCGELLAENIVPACVHEAEDYMASVGYRDEERNRLFGNLYGLKISWKWPLKVRIDGEPAKLTDLAFDAVKKIIEQMLDNECRGGMW